MKRKMTLTEDLDVDGGLSLLAAAARHTLVGAGVVQGGAVEGEGGRGLVGPGYRDVRAVRLDLLPRRRKPVDLLRTCHNYQRDKDRHTHAWTHTYVHHLVQICSALQLAMRELAAKACEH